MNDYCKITARADIAARSRSIDFSDLSFSPPQTPKYPKNAYKAPPDRAPADTHIPSPAPEEEAGAGETFGVILSRNCSSASQRFRALERGHAPNAATTLQAAVRRAFSMRKSSSGAEGYRRIHDTADDGGDGEGDVHAGVVTRQQLQQREARAPRKKRGKKILRACKRIFGF